jgi:hypothetical protein|tara:strand:- start:54796 stop:61083 length:6288 start_codon:yes stop_codon:yes gene_type:complete
MPYCYPNISDLNTSASKCGFKYEERCTPQGLEVTLNYGMNIHHVYIIQNSVLTDTSQYLPEISMPNGYVYYANQASANPTVWQEQTFFYVCGGSDIIEYYDSTSGVDQPDWAQGCYAGGVSRSSVELTYNKIYVYYKGGDDYPQSLIKKQYEGVKEFLADYNYTGAEYHTVIGGGGARWLDWTSSVFTGQINNQGGCSLSSQPFSRCADVTGWENYGSPNANGAVGDTHIWSHGSGAIDDFYCHVDAGTSTSSTSTGATITSLGLPPAATSSDNILVIVFNDESACCYHGEQNFSPTTVNGLSYVRGVEYNSECSSQSSGSITDGSDNNFYKNDYDQLTSSINTYIGNGGLVDTVIWPSKGDTATPAAGTTHMSYALHLSASILSTDGTGMYPSQCKRYFSDWSLAPYSTSQYEDDIVTSIPNWYFADEINTPQINIMEIANPYYSGGYGGLDAYGITFPFNFPGFYFSNSDEVADTQSGLPIASPNTATSQIIPKFSKQLEHVLLTQVSSQWSTISAPCASTENCVTIQTMGLDGIVVGNFPIETDLNGGGSLVTNALGWVNLQNIQQGVTYNIFGEDITFPGSCMEYLVEVYVGTCGFTPVSSCNCGCDDPAANNYDALADYYDSEECPCDYSKLGCTDPNACNYDPLATDDDNTCVFPGCTDPLAANYDATAGCDDGSCKPPTPPCDIAYGEYNPAEFLTDVDIKRIETEAKFADSVYKHFQARRYGMTSPCETTLDGIASEKYLCFWEDKKEKEYTGFKIDREVFKPLVPGTPPALGDHPDWVNPLCGLLAKGELTVYFYYDGTSMGATAVKTAYDSVELWVQSIVGAGYTGKTYHTIVNGERWVDWGTSAITGQFNNSGSNTSTSVPCSNPVNPSCGPGRPCGGCGTPQDTDEGITGNCGCSGWSGGRMGNTLKVQDLMQNGDCPEFIYDTYKKGTQCNTWIGNDGYIPQGSIINWNGPAPAADTEQVLVVCFADETEVDPSKVNNNLAYACYHGRGNMSGTASDWNLATISGDISPQWKNDYDFYIQTYNDFQSRSCNHSLNCFIYPARPATIFSSHKPFPLHAIGGVTSGNRPVRDGTYLTGTAPINTMSGSSIAAIELPGSNLYWNEPNSVTQHAFGYGGLDNYGWDGTFTSSPFTLEGFSSDLNLFFTLEPYQCDDNECLIFDVVNQNGVSIQDYEIILDGGVVGKTDSFGRYTHIVTKASINTEHTAQLCECFTTSGNCAQQRLLITATESCPTVACTVPAKQCTCNAPANLQVSSVTPTSTLLNWTASISTETTITYDIRYRVVNITTPNTWIYLTGVNNTYYSLQNLIQDTKYEFQVRSNCGTITSDWNALQEFSTIDPCPTLDCILSTCTSTTSFTLGYNYSSIGNLLMDASTGTTGTWGVIWGTNSDIDLGNIVNGGSTSTTMVPGTAATYPGEGIPNTLITVLATALSAGGYYWRAYILPTNMPNCTEAQYSDICSFGTVSTTSECAIPDQNFEQALMDLGIKAQGAYTGDVLISAVNTLTSLDVTNKNISSLQGIECFVALEVLKATDNNISSVNLVANTALLSLDLAGNNLTSLNLTTNTLLWYLHVGSNMTITSLDLTVNTALQHLACRYNALTTLDLSTNTLLYQLDCAHNLIVSLDLTLNTALNNLDCSDNPPMNLLDVTNGNNSNMPTGNFIANNTPSLLCISVDVAAYSTTNWTAPLYIDAGDVFNVPCVVPALCTIPDINFRNKLDSLYPLVFPGQWVNTNQVDVSLILPITNLDLANSNISDFTGVECFINLTTLGVNANQAPTIDVTALTSLVFFNFTFMNNGNALTGGTVDISQNTQLLQLRGGTNQLTSMNVDNNLLLQYIYLGVNNITSFSVTNNIDLYSYSIQSNLVTSIDVSTNVLLTTLNFDSNNAAGTLDTSTNVLLENLYFTNNNISVVDFTTNIKLKIIHCQYNWVNGIIDLSASVLLENLNMGNCNITSIVLPTSNTVQSINMSSNLLSAIDVSICVGLIQLEVDGNELVCLDISSNPFLNFLNCKLQTLSGTVTKTLLTLNLANGNNSNIIDANMRTSGNALVTSNCVTVDNVAYSTANWTTHTDFGTVWNLGCSPLGC